LAHRVFRAAGLTGWQTNVPVRCGDRRYFLDIVFSQELLVVEIDGRVHLSRRRCSNRIAAAATTC
jgi:very-short-patch-repair endonuclease